MDSLTPVEPSRTLTKCFFLQEIALMVCVAIELILCVFILLHFEGFAFLIELLFNLQPQHNYTLWMFLFLVYPMAYLTLLYGILKKKTLCFIPYIGLDGILIVLAIHWCIKGYGIYSSSSDSDIQNLFYYPIGLTLLWLYIWLSAIFLYLDFKRATISTEVGNDRNCNELKQVITKHSTMNKV